MASRFTGSTASHADSPQRGAAGEGGNWKALHGIYKHFIAPEKRDFVERWYNTCSSSMFRRKFKELTKLVADPKRRNVRRDKTVVLDDVLEARIMAQQHATGIVSKEYWPKLVDFLTMGRKNDKQLFTDVFCCMTATGTAPYIKSHTKTTFREDDLRKTAEQVYNRALRGVTDDCDDDRREIQAMNLRLYPENPSCRGGNRTAYREEFYWRAQAQLKPNVLQRAHDSSVKGSPWGEMLRTTENWVPHTYEFHKNNFFRGPADPRRNEIRNFNENYTTALYQHERAKRKAREASRLSASAAEHVESPPPLPRGRGGATTPM